MNADKTQKTKELTKMANKANTKNNQAKAATTKVMDISKKLADALKPAAQPKDTGLGPNEKFPFGVRFEENGQISWERFKSAKERDMRMKSLKPRDGRTVEAVDHKPIAAVIAAQPAAKKPTATPDGAPIVIPNPAAKPAAPAKAEKPKPAAKPASDALDLHLNKTGRLCIGKNAAARMGFDAGKTSHGFMLYVIEEKSRLVRLEWSARDAENALEVRNGGGRPYISATKQFKPLGFDGSQSRDIEAKPYGTKGFEFKLA
jgi:hypothetical protein